MKHALERVMRKRIIPVLCAAMLTVLITTIGAAPAQAQSAGCLNVEKIRSIQEGTINIDTAHISIVAHVCTDSAGRLNHDLTGSSVSIQDTEYGLYALGLTYWIRDTRTIAKDNGREQRRYYVEYQSCLVKIVPICTPPPFAIWRYRFHFDVTLYADLVPGVIGRSWSYGLIINNTYGRASWS